MKTRSLGLLGSSLLLALAAACGDDGGSNNNSVCGDGHVTGSETCDDGNTVSLDGCSATCQVEGTCGDGTLDVNREQCDDGNMISGDGCSATCQKEGTCGNGVLEAGESCDDMNLDNGDGCSAICSVEAGYTCSGQPSVCVEDGGSGNTCNNPGVVTLTAMGTDLVGAVTGNTSSSTNQIPNAACDGIEGGAGDGKDHIWTFTTTDVRDVMIILWPDDDFDGGIRMMSACDQATEITDQVGDDGCSDLYTAGGYEILGYVNLPAGTYYISVDGYSAADSGGYELEITASVPSCGDGILGPLEFCDDENMTDGDGCTHCTIDDGYNCDQSEPSVCQAIGCGDGIIQTAMGEECDDDNTDPNDGCSDECKIEDGYSCGGQPSTCVEIACNNGFIEGDEECDDGNANDNDRCSSTCELEYDVLEAAEPNDTTPQALPPGNVIVKGTFSITDVDLYSFTLTEPSKVEIETYGSINGTDLDYDGFGTNPIFDCFSGTDTELAVFEEGADTTNDALALAIDDDDGDPWCSYLGPNDSDLDDFDDVADPTQLAMLPAGTYVIRVQASSLASSFPADTRYMLDLKITPLSVSQPVPPAAGDLKINEFLAADGGSTNGGVDSNCDGKLNDSDDEFLEILNVSNKTLDLTGVTYSDALGVKFTFAPQASGSLTLEPGKAVVVWGGGTPMCPGVTNFFTNGTAHTLSLNDGGDTITLRTAGATPVVITEVIYTSSQAVIGKSQSLSPDGVGSTYTRHDLISGSVGDVSPGKKVDGTAF